MTFRSRHPFPDLTIYDEVATILDAPAEQVRQALERGPEVHPDARELGVDLALGFMPHRGENRRTRRAAVANWQPPQVTQKEGAVAEDPERSTSGVAAAAPATMPTRRELLKQRKRRDRGTLDVELRRLQRKAMKRAH